MVSTRIRRTVPIVVVVGALVLAVFALPGPSAAGASPADVQTTAAYTVAANGGAEEQAAESRAIPAALIAGVATRVAAREAAKFAGKAFAGGFFGALGAKAAGIFGTDAGGLAESEVILDAAR